MAFLKRLTNLLSEHLAFIQHFNDFKSRVPCAKLVFLVNIFLDNEFKVFLFNFKDALRKNLLKAEELIYLRARLATIILTTIFNNLILNALFQNC